MPRIRICNVGTTRSVFKLPKIVDFEILWPVEGSDVDDAFSRPFILKYRDAANTIEEWIEINRYMTSSGAQKEVDELVGIELSMDRWKYNEE